MAISKLSSPQQIKHQETLPTDERNPSVMKAAKLYESQFLREMVRAMRKSVPESEFMPASHAEKIFREQVDDNVVDDWSERGGVGIANLIYEKVMERYGNMLPKARPQGPINVKSEVKTVPVELKKEDLTLKLQVQNGSNEVRAPWNAKVISSQQLDQGWVSLLLDHGDLNGGAKSTLLYKGTLLTSENNEVLAGQRLGLLSPENQGILWRVQGKVLALGKGVSL